MSCYARTQPVGPLRTLALRRVGASPRITVGLSPIPAAGRAAYAVTDVPAGGFFVLYSGSWYEIKSDRSYAGSDRNVVEADNWRIKPQRDKALGMVCPPARLWVKIAPAQRVSRARARVCRLRRYLPARTACARGARVELLNVSTISQR